MMKHAKRFLALALVLLLCSSGPIGIGGVAASAIEGVGVTEELGANTVEVGTAAVPNAETADVSQPLAAGLELDGELDTWSKSYVSAVAEASMLSEPTMLAATQEIVAQAAQGSKLYFNVSYWDVSWNAGSPDGNPAGMPTQIEEFVVGEQLWINLQATNDVRIKQVTAYLYRGSTQVYSNTQTANNYFGWAAWPYTLNTSGSYRFSFYITYTSGATQSVDGYTFTVKDKAPSITSQPSNTSIKVGNTATFSVTASGSNLTYQWYRWTPSNQNWVSISGATSRTYSVTTTAAMNNYWYYCAVSNYGNTVGSSYAQLTVYSTITYDANGGNGAPSIQEKTCGTSTNLSTTVLKRNGYTFLGWSTSSTATSASYLPGGSFSSDSNTTLYAVWQTAETLTLGTSKTANINFTGKEIWYTYTPSATGSYTFSSSASSSYDPELYVYSGSSYTQVTSSTNYGNFSTPLNLTSGTTYYFRVYLYSDSTYLPTGSFPVVLNRDSYTITYNANGGSVSPTSATLNAGSSVTTPTPTKSYTLTYNVNGGNALSPSSKSVSCTCDGWFTATSGGSKRANAGASYTPTQSEPIYAQWTDPSMGTLPTPTHPTAGYSFKGWFTAATGGTQVTSSTVMTGNQTICAQWNIVPGITGPTSMSLAVGYAATSTGVYTVTGSPASTVTKTSGNASITWNNSTKKLDIAAGLAAGSYPVVLKASNGVGTDATITFTLTITNAPGITGPTTMSLTTGYSATSTGVYTVTGNPAPTVTKTSGNANITWNNSTKKLDIAAGLAAGSYPVVLKASNGVDTDATITFTLTVSATYTATISPTSKTFTGATAGYSTQTAQVFTVTNTGTGTISSLAVALSSTTNFEISTALSSTSLAAGGTATVSIRPKTGLAAGTYTATLTVTGSNGISLPATMSFTVSPTYTATISPTSKTFTGATAGYGTQTAQTFTITNTGTGTISSLAAALSSTTNFEISTALSSTSLAAGGTATVSVRPKIGLAAGTYTATLTVTGSNGISLPANLSFTVSPTYKATISPTSKTFTDATVGYGAQTAQVFTITNTGTGTVSSLAAALTSTTNFEISTALSSTSIAAGGTATVSVRPKTGLAAGTYTATLTVTGSNGISLPATLSFTVSAAPTNIYNLGEETYRFNNYGDSDSAGGHCFGMSATSSAYYLKLLDIAKIGGTYSNLYALSATSTVKAPICYYQKYQPNGSTYVTVAGGSWYINDVYNIASDWTAVVNYVKNHAYDDKGSLQIGFRGTYTYNGRVETGGHAINFLRYSEVGGQPRIYAYDNNFPNSETYFYKDASGMIHQAPYSTFDLSITCMALRSVPRYFELAGGYDSTHIMYADRDAITVESVNVHPMDGNLELREHVMFEIPAQLSQVIIIPLIDNATFEYLDNEYSFGKINDDTIGIFTLASSGEGSTQNPSLTIIQGSAQTYTVTLNPNGGSVSPTSITVTNGGTYSALPTPSRANYTFDGWYTAASGGSKVNTTDTVNLTGNTTLCAHWSTVSQPSKKIFSTKYDATFFNWILFFLCFGWIWMWF